MSGTGGETKKDLTSVLEFQKSILEASADSPDAHALPGGDFLSEPLLEKIDQFENLDSYSANHPDQIAHGHEDPAFSSLPLEPALPESFSGPESPPENASENAPENAPENVMKNPEIQFEDSFKSDSEMPPQISAPSSADPFASQLPASEEAFSDPGVPAPTDSLPPLETFDPPPMEKPKESFNPDLPGNVLEKIRTYSDTLRTTPPLQSDASTLFSIFIDGHLSDNEKARLEDILQNEKLDLRGSDFEIQLQSGKVLIPRISEYAAIYIIQALRTTQAEIHFGPADSVFSTVDTRHKHSDHTTEPTSTLLQDYAFNPNVISHLADQMPITTGGKIPSLPHPKTIGLISASAPLLSTDPNLESTAEYNALLAALERELRYKAHHKGAQAIVHFKVQTTRMRSPDYMRILVMGTAIREND